MSIGEGTYIGRNVVVNAAAKVGSMCILNTIAIIEYDCTIGDFTHVSVGAVLCGGVTVGSGVLIGANATVLQLRSVGEQAIVGAGTMITKEVDKMGIFKKNNRYYYRGTTNPPKAFPIYLYWSLHRKAV